MASKLTGRSIVDYLAAVRKSDNPCTARTDGNVPGLVGYLILILSTTPSLSYFAVYLAAS